MDKLIELVKVAQRSKDFIVFQDPQSVIFNVCEVDFMK